MKKIYIELYVKDLQLVKENEIYIPSGNKNYIWVKVDGDKDWLDETIRVLFTRGKDTYENILDDNYQCEVPSIFLEKPGTFFVSLYAGDRKTVNAVGVVVTQGGFTENVSPYPPPPKSTQYVITESDKTPSIREKDGYFQYYSAVDDMWKTVIGGGSGGGGGAIRFIHKQNEASDVWNVQHNLGEKFVSVLIVDDESNQVFGSVDYAASTANLLVVKFILPFIGTAYIK